MNSAVMVGRAMLTIDELRIAIIRPPTTVTNTSHLGSAGAPAAANAPQRHHDWLFKTPRLTALTIAG